MRKQNIVDRKIEVNCKIALDSIEIEKLYGISRGTLANWRVQRIGPPFFQVGKRKIVYKVSDFEKWFFGNPVLTKDALLL